MRNGEMAINSQHLTKILNSRDVYKKLVFELARLADKDSQAYNIIVDGLNELYGIDASLNLEAAILLREMKQG